MMLNRKFLDLARLPAISSYLHYKWLRIRHDLLCTHSKLSIARCVSFIDPFASRSLLMVIELVRFPCVALGSSLANAACMICREAFSHLSCRSNASLGVLQNSFMLCLIEVGRQLINVPFRTYSSKSGIMRNFFIYSAYPTCRGDKIFSFVNCDISLSSFTTTRSVAHISRRWFPSWLYVINTPSLGF